jgi:hypothetical protein
MRQTTERFWITFTTYDDNQIGRTWEFTAHRGHFACKLGSRVYKGAPSEMCQEHECQALLAYYPDLTGSRGGGGGQSLQRRQLPPSFNHGTSFRGLSIVSAPFLKTVIVYFQFSPSEYRYKQLKVSWQLPVWQSKQFSCGRWRVVSWRRYCRNFANSTFYPLAPQPLRLVTNWLLIQLDRTACLFPKFQNQGFKNLLPPNILCLLGVDLNGIHPVCRSMERIRLYE